MKNVIKLTVVLGVLVTSVNCAKKEKEVLSVETNVNQETPLGVGDNFLLKVDANYSNKISTVEIDAASIDFHEDFMNINDRKWEFEKELTITEIVSSGISEISVVVTDVSGNTKTVMNEIVLE